MAHQYSPLVPPIKMISHLPESMVERSVLRNGLEVYSIIGSTEPVTKVELVFFAGRPYEKKKLVATACAALLREGTAQHSSAELAKKIDFYGASLVAMATFDTIRLQLFCLSKHVKDLLQYLEEIVSMASFPTEELDIYQSRSKQRLAVDLAQNEVLAYRAATEHYFGRDHPYGYNSTAQQYDDIERADLIEHFCDYLAPKNAICILAGNPPPDIYDLLDQTLGNWRKEGSHAARKPILPPSSYVSQRLEWEGSGAQTAVRLGRPLFRRGHPDFAGMFVLNTALGGYFGSRLMRNLREERGLTYGVESSLETMRFGGYLTISLETERDLATQAIDEIFREIEILQKKLIDVEELQMVKNYLAGYLLSLMDGPLQIAEILRGNLIRKNGINFARELLREIHDITAEELRSLAVKYLQTSDLSQVIVH